MRFKDVFSIIGPGMVGPSSSHTAGAVRLGRAARRIFGQLPREVEILLYGSFADTYRGHGTDLALVGGLLDFDTDDLRIRDAFSHAAEAGMEVEFKPSRKPAAHPNTATVVMRNDGRTDTMTGASIGGGNVEISNVNGFDVKFTLNYPTLLIYHNDRPGMLAEITRLYSTENVNIGYMDVDRKNRSGDALTVIEADHALSSKLIDQIQRLPYVHRVSMVDVSGKEASG